MGQDLGTFLRLARRQRGLSLREVESVTGVSNAYLSQLEGNKVKSPAPPILHKLAEFYEVSYAETLRLTGYPVPEPRGSSRQAGFAGRIGNVDEEEAEALVEYLAFLRSRKARP